MLKIDIKLLLIFLLALLLRLYSLGNVPANFHGDEVMNGYVGRFTLLNGKDPYGNTWPLLYFNRFGDYPPIMPMYFSGISTFIFGVNEFAVRFPSALLGALIVFPVYFLSESLFFNRKTALFSALLIAILPWHIVLSRATSEGIMGLTVFTFAIFLFLKGLKEKNIRFIIVSSFLSFFTYFLYPSYRILVPITLLPIPFIFNNLNSKFKKLTFFLIIIFIFFTLFVSQTRWGKGRFEQTSLFSSTEVEKRMQSDLQKMFFDEGKNNILLARIFHNKITWYSQEFFNQYLSYFSTDFLVTKGGLPLRYSVPHYGLLFYSLVILLLFSFIPISIKFNKRLFIYILYLLLIAPIPASLTIDDVPNVHRAIFMIVPLVLLFSFGFNKIRVISSKLSYIFILLLFFELIYFFHQYFSHTGPYYSVLRDDGSKQLIAVVADKRNKYDKIFMPVYGSLPFYYLFFTNNFDFNYIGKFYNNNGIKISQIGNIKFIEDMCPSNFIDLKLVNSKTLVIDRGECNSNQKLKELNTIFRKDSTKAYRLLILKS